MTKTFFSPAIITVLALSACMPGPTPTLSPPTSTSIPPTSTPQGRTLLVTSPADSGPGTLRQAMEEAQNGDTITFDPATFPPDEPVTILIESELPPINQGNLTIDASNAGVILDGSKAPGDWFTCLGIVDSDANIVRGMQISNFSGRGIAIAGNAQHNIIGGDRSIGSGPSGQGNMLTFNAIGIHIKHEGASFNTVTGNLIGTDVSGTVALGNVYVGVFIAERANRNTVGPDNIIAYNAEVGVSVAEGAYSNTVGPGNIIAYNGLQGILMPFPEIGQNTITNNDIHDNRRQESKLAPPHIFDHDLQAGTLTGATCANCTVEIFSAQGDEGIISEGKVNADDKGIFSFDKGSSFIGPHLTATVTDLDGNTSEFSRLTVGKSQVLQQGNDFPKTLLQFKESRELPDNRIGANWDTMMYYTDWDHTLTQLNAWGVKRLNAPLYEGEPPIDWNAGSEFAIPAGMDEFIDDLAEHGIQMNLMLHFWDKEGHPRGEELATPRFQNQQQIDDFIKFVRFIVGHFKGRIPYYMIWSEMDYCGGGGVKCILIQDYIEMVRQVIPVIREEDPQAKIITPQTFPFFVRDQIFTLLKSDVISQFDVIAWAPFYDAIPDHEFFGKYSYEYPSLIQEIKQTASAHGFTGEYWGTSLAWGSNKRTNCNFIPGCGNPDHPWEVLETNLQAAKYYARVTILELGLDLVVGIDPMLANEHPWAHPTIRNLNTVMSGTKPLEIPVEIESDGARIASYGFSLPNGDRLFAVWNDNVAVDYDPGVPSTLTFPGTSAQKVIGIDVLHGFEQELIIEMVNGNLVIRDLLVKDYPIILRLVD